MNMEAEHIFIIRLIMASVAVLILPIFYAVFKMIYGKIMKKKHKRTEVRAVLAFSVFLLVAIWLFRYAMGYFSIIYPKENVELLTKGEEIINSLFAALRTFSLDEDFKDCIVIVREMAETLFPGNAKLLGFCVVYASILNIAAPIAGGAIILELLAKIFPRLRLFIVSFLFWYEKCYFGELNESSLALAKSLCKYYSDTLNKIKPIIIFTDTYIDDESEKEYELLIEAKQMGAICVRDDIIHVPKALLGKRTYFLTDENEFENLQSLLGLTEKRNVWSIKKSQIYLFIQTDAYEQIEKRVREGLLSTDKKRKEFTTEQLPQIIPIRSYRNLVHNLFTDVPLYEPLVHKENRASLNITILGNGIIGTEAFLSIYWMGQMLVSRSINGKQDVEECEIAVNVVSKDTESMFWSKIDYINPEIRKTCLLTGSELADENSDILCYNKKGSKCNPYLRVRYIQADVKIGEFWDLDTENIGSLLYSDYFVVALGSDADNISIAEKLRCCIGKNHLETGNTEGTVISYAVFNSELCSALNRKKHYQSHTKGKTDIYMHAFGCLDQVYSCENIFMSKSNLWAEETGNVYLMRQNKLGHISENADRASNEHKNYAYWANLARAMHIKYKVFSLGWIKTSVFDYTTETECERLHRGDVRAMCSQYKRIAISNSIDKKCKSDVLIKSDIESKKHCLAWLEHRRWCAFTRTMGYRYTNCHRLNIELTGSHKNMPIKLHPCLVECKFPNYNMGESYICGSFDSFCRVDKSTMFKAPKKGESDLLDELVADLYKLSLETGAFDCYDFKINDYYRYEFDNYVTSSEAAKLLGVDEGKIIKECVKRKIKGAIMFEQDQRKLWFIPVEGIKKILRKSYTVVNGKSRGDLIKLCEEGKINGAFEFFDDWFYPNGSI